jgi:uncharacterized protein YjiS (DUF1127 family)
MPSLIESIMIGMQRRRTQRSLRQLDDRTLRDIGLTRDEVMKLGTKDSMFNLMMR